MGRDGQGERELHLRCPPPDDMKRLLLLLAGLCLRDRVVDRQCGVAIGVPLHGLQLSSNYDERFGDDIKCRVSILTWKD